MSHPVFGRDDHNASGKPIDDTTLENAGTGRIFSPWASPATKMSQNGPGRILFTPRARFYFPELYAAINSRIYDFMKQRTSNLDK